MCRRNEAWGDEIKLKLAAGVLVAAAVAFVLIYPVAPADEPATVDPAANARATRDTAYDGTGTSSAERVEVSTGGDPIRSLLPLDAIRPIYDPVFVAADDSTLAWGDFVIGLSLNGGTRAYPIAILQFREMVNDDVGGIPVLVTW